jgi:hypothetical protein
MTTDSSNLFPSIIPTCGAIALLSACGEGGSSGTSPPPPSVTSYQVGTTPGTGGTLSPATAAVNAGGTTTLTVTANTGYVIGTVTGCGGTLSGNTYTTGTISANCAVTASFAAAFTWVGGSNIPDASGVYGTQGVAAATNLPRARDGGVTWTDSSGNLWLFGSIRPPVVNGPGKSVPPLQTRAVCTDPKERRRRPTCRAGRELNNTVWIDSTGNVGLFGGDGLDSTVELT